MAGNIGVSIAAGAGSLPLAVVAGYAFDPTDANYRIMSSSGQAGGFETPFDEDGVTRFSTPVGQLWRIVAIEIFSSNGDENTGAGTGDVYLGYSNNVASNTDPGGTKVFYAGMNTTTDYLFHNVGVQGRAATISFDIPASQFPFIQCFNTGFFYTMVLRRIS